MDKKDKSLIQEQLVKLYLRLNGYFTTGFIVHSQANQIRTELDVLAVRFPFHNQDDTNHNSSEFLEVPSNIDIIIGEVKGGRLLQFNSGLRNKKSLEKLLKWTGAIEEGIIGNIIPDLLEKLEYQGDKEQMTFNPITIKISETQLGTITIRPLLFHFKKTNGGRGIKFVDWDEINNFIWKCLCPDEIRKSCGVRYDFNAWGSEFTQIVRAYKDRYKNNQPKFENFNEFYKELKE